MAAVTFSWTDESVTSEGSTNTINSSANVLEFDAVVRLVRTSKADVTQYTVESGAGLTDHKKKLPRTITVTGLVTNTPTDAPPPNGKGESTGVTVSTRNAPDGNYLVFSREFDRVQDVWDSLQSLVENPIFVTLDTPQQTFERVTVTAVEQAKDDPNNNAIFVVTLQEIFVGETETVEVPIPLNPRGQSSRDQTASSTQTDDRYEPPESWALNIGEGLGVF